MRARLLPCVWWCLLCGGVCGSRWGVWGSRGCGVSRWWSMAPWLFAVALGLQEQRRAAVFRALPPIALGHALSIGIIIAVVLLARVGLPHRTLKIAAAAILF